MVVIKAWVEGEKENYLTDTDSDLQVEKVLEICFTTV